MDKPTCSTYVDDIEELPDYETATNSKASYGKQKPADSGQDAEKEEEPKSPEYEFASGTTMHGLGKIADAPNYIARFIWTIFFLTAFGYAAYLITQTFISYFNWETITDVSLEFSESLQFPAVTLCNFNKFEQNEVSQDIDAIDYLGPLIGNAFLPDTGGDVLHPHSNDSLYSLNLISITEYAGFRLDSRSLMDCTWKGEKCYPENFTQVYSTFGNCYIFNGPSNQQPIVQTIPGAGNGLHLVVDVKKDLYTEDLDAGGNSDVGLKLHVHPKHEPPVLDTQGIAVGPGSHAYVGISQVTYVNEVPPWGICEDVKLDHYDTYTFSACMLECKTDWVQDKCNCTALELLGTILEGDPDICSPQIVTDCVNTIYQQIQTGELACHCPTPCQIVEYDTTVSYAGWPNPKASETLTRDFPAYSLDYLKENWVVFDVFYKQLNFQRIEQKRKTSLEGLLSILGGCLGLCVGASVVSIAEFAYYLLLRPAKFIMKCKKKNMSASRTNIVTVRESPRPTDF